LSKKILLVEAKKPDGHNIGLKLSKKGFEVHTAYNSNQALSILREVKIDVILINAISLNTNGARLTATIDKQDQSQTPIVLLVNEPLKITTRADLVLSAPITPQKLINRFAVFFPKDESDSIMTGPIKLDINNRLVSCNDKTTKLTPKLFAILKILIDHKGVVVHRNEIFTKIWDTDYLGDTRTLDVHISWLRNALEIDPSDPKLIETERGVGFRLAVD